MESWGRKWIPNPGEIDQRMSVPHAGVVMSTVLFRSYTGFDKRYRIAGDYDLLSRVLKSRVRELLWLSAASIGECRSGGVSELCYLEAYLEESLIRLRVWGKTNFEVAGSLERYLLGPFKLLAKRETEIKGLAS